MSRRNADRTKKHQGVSGRERPSDLEVLNRFCCLAGIDLDPATTAPGPCRAAIEYKCPVSMNRCRREIMGQAIAGRQHRLGQRISITELRRTPGKLASGRLLLVRSWTEVMAPAQAMAPSRQRHRERVGWRTFHRPFEQFERHLFRRSLN